MVMGEPWLMKNTGSMTANVASFVLRGKSLAGLALPE
jgi:hypothetical protein